MFKLNILIFQQVRTKRDIALQRKSLPASSQNMVGESF